MTLDVDGSGKRTRHKNVLELKVHAIWTYGGSEGTATFKLNLGTRWR